jgi:predicted metallo-beta-lactamase superfamily hydrolase
MEVKLVAFESMGVRSMCTHVRTPDISILIDPSAACHDRSGLAPHPREYEMIIRKRAEMVSLAKQSDVIAISHYHLDHLSPQETDLRTTFSTRAFVDAVFRDKVLFCKDFNNNVTERQGLRGRKFHKVYGKRAQDYQVADGGSFSFGKTRVDFSDALWHGKEGTVQGYVVGTCIRDGDTTMVHASDVQLLNRGCVDWMLDQNPDLAITAGPPMFDPERMKNGEREIAAGLLRRLSAVPRVVVDHHLLRSPEWEDFLREGGDNVFCATAMEKVPTMPMESQRGALYEAEEVDEGFHGQLRRGRMPNRLRPVVAEVGMESIFKPSLKW